MISRRSAGTAVCALAALLAGCQTPAPSDMTLQRGSQLLASGSPKSAIPFLTQTIASTPDGPEPLAMLSLAYALDMQDLRAISQARQIHARPDRAAGWEWVAIGIAEMIQQRPGDAEASLQRVVAGTGPENPTGLAARQWLALAQVLEGDRPKAIETLQALAEAAPMKTSAMLWTVLLHAQAGETQQASESLVKCAAAIARQGETVPAGELSGQALYDSAVAALAGGDLAGAQGRFQALQTAQGATADGPVWMALITGARGDWPASRAMLKEASQSGPSPSRGLASQLLSVVCAMENRPDAMIEHMLAGQRMLGRNQTPAYVVEQPKIEPVWLSDIIK
jgi:tetratricopeptide (TPR) repeat protein